MPVRDFYRIVCQRGWAVSHLPFVRWLSFLSDGRLSPKQGWLYHGLPQHQGDRSTRGLCCGVPTISSSRHAAAEVSGPRRPASRRAPAPCCPPEQTDISFLSGQCVLTPSNKKFISWLPSHLLNRNPDPSRRFLSFYQTHLLACTIKRL